MNTSILKLEATVIRPKDDDELDGLAASISFHTEVALKCLSFKEAIEV